MKRHCVIVIIVVFVACLCLMLAGCLSVDADDSTIEIGNVDFQYDEGANQTKVVFYAELSNDTIFDLDGFSLSFTLHDVENNVYDVTYNYAKGLDHGEYYSGYFNFVHDGKIDNVEYISMQPNYSSFWETYKIWLIIAIVLFSVASLIYIIIMLIEDLELDEVGEFISEHVWVLSVFTAPLIVVITGFIYSTWVVLLIIIGAIIAFILVALLAHLIKHLIQWGVGGSYFFGDDFDIDGDEIFDNEVEDVEDYVNKEEKLELFNVKQLKEYCRDNGIKGYSSLNKHDLIALIMGNAESDTSNNVRGKFSSDKRNNVKDGEESKSKITFDDIAGLEEAKTSFREKIVLAFKHRDLYEKFGKKVGGGILLYGLPGTGKTMFAEAASNEVDAMFIPVKCSDIKSKWYGESEANVKQIFEKARKAGKAIIFFDEFEAIGSKRTDNRDNANNDLVPQILAEMQGVGCSNSKGIIVTIAATNKPWSIDSAFLRPGRFDEKIYIPLPDYEARKRMFELKLKDVPQDNIDYDFLAKITDKFNGADIGGFCDKMKMNAINRSIVSGKECPLTMEDVEKIRKAIKSSVSQEDVDKLIEFRNQFG